MTQFLFPQSLGLNMQAYFKWRQCYSGLWMWVLEDLTPDIWTLRHVKKHENPAITSPLKSLLPHFPDFNLFDYYLWDAVDGETHETPCKTKDELNEGITAEFIQFKQGDNQEGLQKAVVEVIGDFF